MSEKQLLKQRKQLDSQIDKLRMAKPWRCLACERTTQVRFLTLIVENYYIEPYSCTGGAYWTEGENPTYRIKCPKCNQEIRLYHSRYEHTKEWLATKYGRRHQREQKLWQVTNEYRYEFKSETTLCKD